MAVSTNTLSKASSPYLLQHAKNPVHWFEWGDEAFTEAREQDKPVFLSIGYATCHWCHVMAHESFEDDTVAQLMNKAFINIKVDREERPDIDNTYMHVCQMLTGRGGWPLTIIMTPEKKPFYAATYIPKSGRQGQPGMMELIPRLSRMWNEERDKIKGSAQEIMEAFQQSIKPQASRSLSENIFIKTFSTLQQQFDPVHGGFGSAPKFPTPHTLTYLLRHAHAFEQKEAAGMVDKTLTGMRFGGLFDQVGGGFHRYSTDPKWLLPHFEKMLYDQAMHMMTYTEGWQALGKPLFKQTAGEIAAYLMRDLQHADGAFYSAEDADSEGEEGTFYVWTVDEVRDILPAAAAELAIEVFNMEAEGNYADEASGRRTGKNILHLSKSVAELAEERDMEANELEQKLETIRQQLFDVREKRERPFLDDKILTDWNGLTIAALAKAGRGLDEPVYTSQAQRAAAFISDHMIEEDSSLLHRWRAGEAAISGTADDYAFLIWGLLELYESIFHTRYLKQAVSLQRKFLKSHWDDENGGFFFTSAEEEELMGRKKEYFDSALPSGNSVAAMNLLRLGRITANTEWENKAEQIAASTSEMAEKVPTSFTQLLQAHLWAGRPSSEIVIAGPAESEETQVFLRRLRDFYEPHSVVLLNNPDDDAINEIAPFTQQQTMRNGKPTAYVCRNYSCNEPTNDPDRMMELFEG